MLASNTIKVRATLNSHENRERFWRAMKREYKKTGKKRAEQHNSADCYECNLGTKMKKYQVFGIGAALVDIEVSIDDEFLQQCDIEKGFMTLVDEERQQQLMEMLDRHMSAAHYSCGGSAANSIIAVSSFGGSAYYACKVANDKNGDFYLNSLRDAGVAADFDAERDYGITGKCLVMVSDDAERTMNTFLGISETLSVDNINEEALKQSEWLYIEGYLVTSETGRAAAIKAREIAQANGVKVALTLSDPGMVEFFKDGLQAIIGDKVDLIFCNEHEAKQWAASDTVEAAFDAIKTIAHRFVVTQSERGAYIFDGNKIEHIDAVKTTAIDANGAGDAFAGAFLYGINNGMSYVEAGKLAASTASAVVSQFGPRLKKEEYQALLAKH